MSSLSDVALAIVDCEHKTAPTQLCGIPSIRTTNIRNGRLDLESANRVSEETYREWTARMEPRVGDLILAREAPVGEVGIVPSGTRVCLGQRTVLVRPDPDQAVPRYLLYLLLTPEMQHELKARSEGSTTPHLNVEDIRRFELPELPELPHQQRIAHILGTLDDRIELNRRMNRTLEAIARAIFKSWFVDFDPVHAEAKGCDPVGMDPQAAALFPDSFQDSPLGKIPQGWQATTLGEICEKPQYGYTQSAAEEPVGPRFLRIKDINKQPWIEWAAVPYCEIDEANYDKYRLRAGDIVVARIADPGHAALIRADVDAVFASYLIRFRLLDQSYSHFVQYWLKSPGYWALVRARRSGSTRGNLNAKVLSGFPVLVPPAALAERFRLAVEPLAKMTDGLLAENANLSAARDVLLPKLLSGDLDVGNLPVPKDRCDE